MAGVIKVVAISGSLRKASYNTGLIRSGWFLLLTTLLLFFDFFFKSNNETDAHWSHSTTLLFLLIYIILVDRSINLFTCID